MFIDSFLLGLCSFIVSVFLHGILGSYVVRYNKTIIDWYEGNSKFIVPREAECNSWCREEQKTCNIRQTGGTW